MLSHNEIPSWILNLEIDELEFIKKLILFSGSLKDLAKDYEVTYPTIRIRVDKIIEKIVSNDTKDSDPYVEKIKSLALNDKIDYDTAKYLIDEYKKVKKCCF